MKKCPRNLFETYTDDFVTCPIHWVTLIPIGFPLWAWIVLGLVLGAGIIGVILVGGGHGPIPPPEATKVRQQSSNLEKTPIPAIIVVTVLVTQPVTAYQQPEQRATQQPSQQYARISSVVVEVNLRRSPGYVNKDDSTDVIIKIPSGGLVEVIKGPQSMDDLQWWYVSWNGYEGWIADHTGKGRIIMEFNQ